MFIVIWVLDIRKLGGKGRGESKGNKRTIFGVDLGEKGRKGKFYVGISKEKGGKMESEQGKTDSNDWLFRGINELAENRSTEKKNS